MTTFTKKNSVSRSNINSIRGVSESSISNINFISNDPPSGVIQTKVGTSFYDSHILYNGEIYGTGNNNNGSLGLGDTDPRSVFTKIPDFTDVIAMDFDSGGYGTAIMALKSDGSVWVWGRGGMTSPTQVAYNDWSAISMCSAYNGFSAIRNGKIYAWIGTNSPAELETTKSDWVKVSNYTNDAFHAIDSSGRLYTWGSASVNEYGALGHGHTEEVLEPTQVGSYTDWVWTTWTWKGSMFVRSNGYVYDCGYNKTKTPTRVSDHIININIQPQASNIAIRDNGEVWEYASPGGSKWADPPGEGYEWIASSDLHHIRSDYTVWAKEGSDDSNKTGDTSSTGFRQVFSLV